MSNYPKMTITYAGHDMIAESQADKKPLIFTKVVLGDGQLSPGQRIEELTAPIATRMDVPLSSGQKQSNGQVKLRFSISNSALEEGFFVREVTVYAKVGDDGQERLYAYTNGGNYVDFMPDKTNPVDAQIMNIYIVTGNATNVQIVVNSAIYMTIADLNDALTAHNTAPDAHMDIRQLAENAGLNLLRRNKTYAIGDIAYSKNLPSWARLECIKAGTTAADEPAAIATVSTGGVLLSDGSVLWIIDDIRDGTPVGAVRGSLYLPAGYVKANGATVQRADYPRLVALAERHNLWTDGTAANAGLFGRGDGAATFVLPNWVDRMAQLAGDNAGASVAAGLPNITGEGSGAFIFGSNRGNGGYIGEDFSTCKGALVGKYNSYGAAYGNSNASRGELNFDASRSNPIYGASATVQPAAIKLIPIIRY